MGLAISQTIAEDHGGNISATDSEAGGALFRLALPSADASLQSRAAAL
jgi:C4-dicarboxylate-specific signal transduction histidine kinase